MWSETEGGQEPLDFGQKALDGVGHLDGVRARLAQDGHDHRPLFRLRGDIPGGDLVVFHAVNHSADLIQPDRSAVPVGHDDRPVRRSGGQLAGRLDGERLAWPLEGAGGQIDVRPLHRRHYLVNADLPAGQGARVQLDTHRELLRSEDLHLGHTVDHGDALGQKRVAVFVELVQRQGGGGKGEVEYGLVGRVDFLIRGWGGHVWRQLRARPRNRRLHVLRRRVDVAAKVELERDLRVPQPAR